MNNRIRLAIMLVLYCVIFWEESPDAIAPLAFAIPYFTIPAAKIGIVQVAAWSGWLAVLFTLIAFKERSPARITLIAKIGLCLSAGLFIACSTPVILAAITAVPFAVVALWPYRKQKSPNQTLHATAAPPGS
ncbi:MAG: hypothetical protein ACK45B_13015 [Limisphaerales bacterium]